MQSIVFRCNSLPKFTKQNVHKTLDEIRPYLKSDGGNVKVHSVKNKTVKLILQGNCSTCPSSSVTMTRSIVTLLEKNYPDMEKVIEVKEDGSHKMSTTEDNIKKVVDELNNTVGNSLSLIEYNNNIIKIGMKIGPSSPISLRVSITQKIKTSFTDVMIVQIVNIK